MAYYLDPETKKIQHFVNPPLESCNGGCCYEVDILDSMELPAIFVDLPKYEEDEVGKFRHCSWNVGDNTVSFKVYEFTSKKTKLVMFKRKNPKGQPKVALIEMDEDPTCRNGHFTLYPIEDRMLPYSEGRTYGNSHGILYNNMNCRTCAIEGE